MTVVALPARTLTPQQRAVVRLTWLGLHDRQIGVQLGLTTLMVSWHLGMAYRRLGLVNSGSPRTMAALWLWRQEGGKR